MPFAFYGAPTVNRFYTPAIARFIRRLAYAGGTDVLLTPFEPFDEPPRSPSPATRTSPTSAACRRPARPATSPAVLVLAFVAASVALINIFGGFGVAGRMIGMFRKDG